MEGVRIVKTMEELVEFVFPNLDDPYQCLSAGVLSAKNKQIDKIHDYILEVSLHSWAWDKHFASCTRNTVA